MNTESYKNETQRGIGSIVIVAVIALVAIVGGLFLYKMRNKSTTMIPAVENQTATSTPAPASGTSLTGPSGVMTGSSGVTSASDSTDAALDKDTQNINTQMNALNSDSTNIDQGLNATPENLQ